MYGFTYIRKFNTQQQRADQWWPKDRVWENRDGQEDKITKAHAEIPGVGVDMFIITIFN